MSKMSKDFINLPMNLLKNYLFNLALPNEK